MPTSKYNTRKIINDPVYGFITIPGEQIFSLIEHPYFQRLRRIKQLGLTHLVFPGAQHTRFQHSLGAMHLMTEAITALKSKGHEFSEKEEQASYAAILLHDIGHGPFSHALEHAIVSGVNHEQISLILMERLNRQFRGSLENALMVFKGRYPRQSLHQLVSGQLDMDRLDYLKRDSFFCGVAEGIVNDERIIKMLTIKDDNLVIEAKGIYSIEKFLISRRLMYWQVYLHKTVLSAESILMQILRRGKYLSRNGEDLFAPRPFHRFLNNEYFLEDFNNDESVVEDFVSLDDFDIITSVKQWINSKDRILSLLSENLIHRRLFRVEMQEKPFDEEYLDAIRKRTGKLLRIDNSDTQYFVISDTTSNYAYDPFSANINVLFKDGTLKDIATSSDLSNISALAHPVIKYFLCYPKEAAVNKI